MKAAVILTLIITGLVGAQTGAEYEASQIAMYLGIKVKPFPQLTGYDDLPPLRANLDSGCQNARLRDRHRRRLIKHGTY